VRKNNGTDGATNGETMATIRREIEIQASPQDVGATWDRFVRRALSGQYRLVCGEFACVNAIHSGDVVFATTASGTTNVVFRLDLPADESGPSPDELAQHMTHDLIVFKDYIEREGLDAGHPTLEEDVLFEKEADARGDQPRHVRLSAENDTTFWRSHFPT
jgi:hypothetical protein